MAAAAENGNAAARSAGGGDSSKREDDDWTKLTRRRIYFHRLVGDLGEAQKVSAGHGKSMKAVARFLFYALIANIVIVTRTMIGTCHAVTAGLKLTLMDRPINPGSADKKTFRDIQQPGQVIDWMRNVLIAQSQVSLPYSYPLSLLSYNRITPQVGACPNTASVRMSMRRIKPTRDYVKTTTERFWQLYPEAWMVESISPGSSASEWEEMDPLNRSFKYRSGSAEKTIPSSLFGNDQFGAKLDPNATRTGVPVHATWDYSPSGGYMDAGGYVAMITLGIIDLQTDEDNVTRQYVDVTKQYVHLESPRGEPMNKTLGICEDSRATKRATNVLTVEDFIAADFFGNLYSSITLDFVVYNANYQTMSYVLVKFWANAAGMIESRTLGIDTFWLDIANTDGINAAMVYLEVAYLFGTIFYFADLGKRVWKNYQKSVKDVWIYINLASIISSMVALGIWLGDLKPGLQSFITSNDFQDLSKVNEMYSSFLLFSQASSFALLTIWLRFLETLGKSKARVELLLTTLGMSATNMGIYVGYISVILMGFVAVALTSFSAYSWNYRDIFTGLVSSFELFLGKVDVMESVPRSNLMKLPYYLLFMIFFFFICVQMFNAIINYSYNRVSELMEDSFQRERDEKKRKERNNKYAKKTTPFRKVMDVVSRIWQPKDARDEKDAAKQEGAGDAALSQAQGADMPALENIDIEDLRAKVDAFLGQEKQRKAPEGCSAVCLFIIFAASYIAFLYVNLSVPVNARIQNAVESAVVLADDPFRLGDVSTVTEMAQWVTVTLPRVVFESTDPDIIAQGVADDVWPADAVCIATWNCLIPGYAKGHTTPKIMRLTQRRLKNFNNLGTMSSVDAPPAVRFVGNYVDEKSLAVQSDKVKDMVPFSEFMVRDRRSRTEISPDSATSPDDEDREWSLVDVMYNGEPLCRTVTDGAYGGHGGSECYFDADHTNFTEQLSLLADEKNNFYNLFTACLAIEFLAYNGNAKTLIYTAIKFTVFPSGKVTAQTEVSSMLLMDITNFENEHTSITIKLVPGAIYVFLVMWFLAALLMDLKGEWYRRFVNEGKSHFQTTIEFFTRDIFNALEVFSITISLVSFVIYIIWIVKETDLENKVESKDFGACITFGSELANSATLYNRLSALNMLIIFVRPLKFLRENARMAKLNQTLYDAFSDISWFVLVFIIAMFAFVMFAHISFGTKMEGLATIPNATAYCFYYILGTFDFWPLHEADSVMSIIFYFPYLLLFYCVFTNIFFAIIDRNFVSAEPPPFNPKRALKPVLSRICRCIEWDEDYVMEDDPNGAKKSGPPTRKNRVHQTAEKIAEIEASAGDNVQFAETRKTKQLNEVCDMDERMSEVLHWSREEAKRFVDDFQRLLLKKQDPKKMKAEELFIRNEVIKEYVDPKLKNEKDLMESAERHKRYAIQVHEHMAVRDQETLARYIQLLERKIKKRMTEKKSLLMEVFHLKCESEKMRYTEEERKRNETGQSQAQPQVPQGNGTLQLTQNGTVEEESEASSDDGGAPGSLPPSGTMTPSPATNRAQAASGMLSALTNF